MPNVKYDMKDIDARCNNMLEIFTIISHRFRNRKIMKNLNKKKFLGGISVVMICFRL